MEHGYLLYEDEEPIKVEILGRDGVSSRKRVRSEDGYVGTVNFVYTEEEIVNVMINRVRNSLKFLVQETDVMWSSEVVETRRKFDGEYEVQGIVFRNPLDLTDTPIDTIREDEV